VTAASTEPVTSPLPSAAVNDDHDDRNDVTVTSPAGGESRTKKKMKKNRKSSRKSEEIAVKVADEPTSQGTDGDCQT